MPEWSCVTTTRSARMQTERGMSAITRGGVAKRAQHIARIGMGHARRARINPPTSGIDATMAYATPTIAAACTAVNGAGTIPARPGLQSAMSFAWWATAPIHKTNAVMERAITCLMGPVQPEKSRVGTIGARQWKEGGILVLTQTTVAKRA